MDNIRQERPNEGPILNFNKQEIWQDLNKKYGTHVEKSMAFKTFKVSSALSLEIKLSAENPSRVFKI